MKNWLVGVLTLALGLGGGIFLVKSGALDVFGHEDESHNSQVVSSLRREEQVVLLSLGVQGISEERTAKTVLGHTVPGSGRTLFLQYNYRAKLGIDGRAVTITEKGDKSYLVSIPPFAFLGHDEVTFKTAIEDNGVISWVTPEIDKPAVITKILNDQTRQQHVDDNVDLLQEQAKAFYEGIVKTVQPDATLEFEFREKI